MAIRGRKREKEREREIDRERERERERRDIENEKRFFELTLNVFPRATF
jgi:hypothetical protein